MIPLEITPTPLPRPSTRSTRKRRLQIGAATSRHVAPALARRQPLAQPVRRTFDELGATFIKFGQLIGSAGSLFGDEVAAEFRTCLDQGPAVPFPEVKRTVEADLGRPLDDVFARFDERPLAAASIAVVHRATLIDGRDVAVKLLRPNIEKIVAADLAVMRPLADFAGRQIAVGIAGVLPGLIDGLEQQLQEELDLRNEVRALQWFGSVLRDMDLPRMRVPEPLPELCGRRVLVMEFLDGVPVDDVSGIEALGIDPRPLVTEALKGFFATTLCFGLFHGDIHAGNLMVTRDGYLGVVDWGIVGRLDPGTHQFIRRAIEGVLGDDGAWPDVHAHLKGVYGGILQSELGATDEFMADFIKQQIEAIFTRPFGEVDIKILLEDAPRPDEEAARSSALATFRRWRNQRRFQQRMLDSEGMGSDFDRSTFLLGKQLVYFERYGKLYTPDLPLVWDRDIFVKLLAEPLPA